MRYLFLLLLCLLGVGCKHENPMVGTWNLKFAQETAGQAAVTMEFKDDESFQITTRFKDDSRTAKGTYKLEGKQLTIISDTGESRSVTLADDMKSFETPGGTGIGKMVKQSSEKP